MNRFLAGLTLTALAFSLFVLPNSGCTKTNTVTDTVTKRDTTIVTDTVKVYWDTTYRHINDSLWAYYKFNGNLADSSGNNHAITLYSGAALGIDAFGRPDSALNFIGGACRAIIADGTNFTAPDFTVSFLVQYTGANTIGLVFNKIDYDDATGYTFGFGTDAVFYPNRYRFSFNNAPASQLCSTPISSSWNVLDSSGDYTLSVNSWYMFTGTFSNGHAKFYKNGILVAQQTLPVNNVTFCSNASFELGNWWASDNTPAFHGNMDEVRIYTRAITDKEAKYLFNTFQRH
ncbi:MAG TPA: LamG domain-containing protein [Dinghuibacter sp.]|uniref:LamG domain-containing protein n=1 Tax=Dinghuibacter sp. TaxID=2024697 RepID=UPI002BEAF146|nr:LamG domain-containing protein [Dinghuibacter sp.]HTJ12605.1 LamG domain-containing protein [Dinghuibacter sp.]